MQQKDLKENHRNLAFLWRKKIEVGEKMMTQYGLKEYGRFGGWSK